MEVRTAGEWAPWVFHSASMSLIGQRSRHQAFPSFVTVPLSCSCSSFMSPVFFVPTNPRFISLFSLSVRAAEAAVRYCFALSPPNPTSALPHNCHNNSIHSSLFIQYCQGRLILTVGVKTYIIDIKHPHPRRSKRWSWQTTTIDKMNYRYLFEYDLSTLPTGALGCWALEL